jgi:uncharacterized protein (DUF4415 family)
MTRDSTTVRYTAAELDAMIARGEDRTNWERVDALTEEELEASIDIAEEGEIDWARVEISVAGMGLVHIDPEVLAWFREQGPGYQTRMNQVLRSYVEAQRDKTTGDEGRKAS